MRKRRAGAALLLSAFLLTGCAGKDEGALPTPTPGAPITEKAEIQGPLAQKARALMAPYQAALSQAAQESPDNLVYTLPGEILNQMAQDAYLSGAEAQEGRWAFSWRQGGDYTYESSAQEAMDALASLDPDRTEDPADEAPMDSQLNGDYAVSGGGVFDRVRTYDAAEDLSFGAAEWTDTLNGQETGHEVFRFSLREGSLYFADATLDMAADLDGVSLSGGCLAAVGVLRADGLDIVEYALDSLEELPDPATVDMGGLLSRVAPISHVTVTVKENGK